MAGQILTNAKPPVDDDVVYIHVAAEGRVNGQLLRKEFVRAYKPIGGWRKIADGDCVDDIGASVVSVIEMVRDGALPRQGFLKQEDIPLAPYLETRTGNFYNIGHKSRHA